MINLSQCTSGTTKIRTVHKHRCDRDSERETAGEREQEHDTNESIYIYIYIYRWKLAVLWINLNRVAAGTREHVTLVTLSFFFASNSILHHSNSHTIFGICTPIECRMLFSWDSLLFFFFPFFCTFFFGSHILARDSRQPNGIRISLTHDAHVLVWWQHIPTSSFPFLLRLDSSSSSYFISFSRIRQSCVARNKTNKKNEGAREGVRVAVGKSDKSIDCGRAKSSLAFCKMLIKYERE